MPRSLTPHPELLTARQIEAFVQVMRGNSISKAARSMSVSQPAVSRLIRDMETTIGLTLFLRNGPKLTPTPIATQLAAEVERVYLGLDHIRDYSRLLRRFPQGQLRLAVMNMLSHGFLAELAMTFVEDEPGISLAVHSDSSVAIIDQLRREEHHIGLCTSIGNISDQLEETRLPSQPAVCILHPSNPLAGRKIITPHDLAHEPFIALGPTSILRRQIFQAFDEAGIEPQLRHETQFSTAACWMVRSGFGASIVDPYCLAGHEPGALAIRPFHPIIDYGFSMLVPRTFRNLPEIRSFREKLIAYCQSGARWLPGSEATAGRSSI